MNGRRVVEDIPATPHFDFLYGRYHLSSWIMPYFSTLMSMRDVADSLRLAADFPGSDEVQWRLDELYQREVDWPRVERRIVPYLHATEQPQFFNALTIALLPMGHSLADTEHAFSDDRTWRAPGLTDSNRFQKVLTVGPISCGYWIRWDDFSQAEARTGQIRWNPEEVFAVALDGQHRLAAIQRFVENPGIPEDQLRATSVPVIFVALDPRFGYETPTPKSLVDVLRIIFIDLNKHAKIPTRARQILLDDKDPTSVCVRALVGEAVNGDTTELQARPARLPLALVDWHTEQAKFDEGPYITTILNLDWAITALLGARPVQNFMDYNAIRKQVQALSQWLYLDMTEASRRLDDLEAVELQPFSYVENADKNELEQIAGAFQQVWSPVFIALLTEFVPYRDLILQRRTQDSFTLDFANWYRSFYQQKRDPYEGRATAEYRQLLGRLQTGLHPLGEGTLRALLSDIDVQKENNLAYNVVFQRAYFLAFREWLMVDEEHLEDLEVSDMDGAFEEEADEEGEYDEGEAANDGVTGEPGTTVDDGVNDGTASLAAHLRQRAREFVECLNAVVDRVPAFLEPDCFFDYDDEAEGQRFWLGNFGSGGGGDRFYSGCVSPC